MSQLPGVNQTSAFEVADFLREESGQEPGVRRQAIEREEFEQNQEDLFWDSVAQRAHSSAGMATIRAAGKSPDEVAETIRRSQKLGLPTEVVERNSAKAFQMEQHQEMQRLLMESPVVARWLSQGQNLAVAQDDISLLELIEKTVVSDRDVANEDDEGVYDPETRKLMIQWRSDLGGPDLEDRVEGGGEGWGIWVRNQKRKRHNNIIRHLDRVAAEVEAETGFAGEPGERSPALQMQQREVSTALPTGPRTFLERAMQFGPASIIPFASAVQEAEEYADLYAATQRVISGNPTVPDLTLLLQWDNDLRRGDTWAAGFLDLTLSLPAFAGEYAMTGGLYTGGRHAAKIALRKTLRTAMRKHLRHAAMTRTTQIAGHAAGVALQGTVGMAPRTIGETIARRTPQLQGIEWDDGDVDFIINRPDDGFVESLGKAVGGNVIEMFAERFGGKLLREGASKIPVAAKFQGLRAGLAARYLRLDPTSTFGTISRRIATAGGWDGILEEIGEEEIAKVLRYATTIDDTYELTTPEEFTQMLAAFSVFPAASIGIQASVHGRREARTAQNAQAFVLGLGGQVQNSKVMKRLPQKAQEFIAEATKDGPIETMYLPADRFQEFFQSAGVDAQQLATELTGDPRALDAALAAGQDLVIPTAAYARHIATNEAYNQAMSEHVRFSPDMLTAAESRAMFESLQAEQEQAASETAVAEQQSAVDKIRQDAVRRLDESGIESSTARQYADLLTEGFTALAERSGRDVTDLWETYGPEVVNRSMAVDRLHPDDVAAMMTPADLGPQPTRNYSRASVRRQLEARPENQIDAMSHVADRMEAIDDSEGDATLESTAIGSQRLLMSQEQYRGLTPGQKSRVRAAGVEVVPDGVADADYDAVGRESYERALQDIIDGESRLHSSVADAWRSESADPDLRMLSWLHAHAPRQEVQDAAIHEIRTEELYDGDALTIYGHPFVVEGHGEARELVTEGMRLPIQVMDTVPLDAGSLQQSEVMFQEVGGDPPGQINPQFLRPPFVDLQGFEQSLRGPVSESGPRAKAMAIAQKLTEAGWRVRRPREAVTTRSVYFDADSPDGARFIGFRVSDHGASGQRRSKGLRGKGSQIDIGRSTPTDGIMAHVERRADTYSPEGRERAAASGNAGPAGQEFFQSAPQVDTNEQDVEYRGQHTAPTSYNGAPAHDVTGGGEVYPDDVYGPNGASYYGSGDARDNEAFAIINRLRGRPDADVTIYRALPKGRGEINHGDWVAITRDYARDHGEGPLNGDYQIITKTVKARDIFTNGDSIQEWGYDPQDAGQEFFQSAPQVDTPAFREWFGDSKVVDENGEPLVVYHGTAAVFDEFRTRGTNGKLGAGAYFGGRNHFRTQSSPASIPVYLSLKNPLTVDTVGQFHETVNALPDPPVPEEGWGSFGDIETAKLEAAGYDGVILTGDRLGEFVAFRPTQIKSAIGNRGTFDRNDPNILHQSDPNANKRGSLQIGPNRSMRINLFEKANLSTFLHETGHLFLEVLGDLATAENAAPQQQADFQALLAWFGVESRDQITREHHEKFAETFEQYLMEGKAPSSALRRAFASFRLWLTSVYRRAKLARARLTPEVRGVMDRLLATQEQIDAAEAEAGMQAFDEATAKSIGMTPKQYQAYRQATDEAREAAEDQVRIEAMRELHRERTAAWKEEYAKVRDQVAAELATMPEYIALANMQNGKLPDGSPLPEGTPRVRLDKSELVRRYGSQILQNLPGPKHPRARGNRIYAVKDGMPVDLAAGAFGLPSGDAMIQSLVTMEGFATAVAAEARARMRERYPDPMLDGSIADDAMAAVHSDRRSKVLELELEHLFNHRRGQFRDIVRRTAARLPHRRQIRAQAEAQIGGMAVRDIRPGVYLAAQAKAGKEAMRLVLRGDREGAFAHKQRELLNFELHRAAMAAQQNAEKIRLNMRRYQEPAARARIGKAGHDYLEQIDDLLDRFEFARVTNRELDRRAGLQRWIDRKREDGEDIDVPEHLLDESYRMNWRQMPYGDLVDVANTVEQIAHQARFKNRLLANRKKQDFEAARDEAVAAAEANMRKRPAAKIEAERTAIDRAKNEIDAMFQAHLKMSTWVEMLDGGRGGIWWELLARPFNEAQDREDAMRVDAGKLMAENLDVWRRAGSDAMNSEAYIPEIGGSLRLESRIAVALNWGNEGNRERLMAGHEWNAEQVQAIIDTLEKRDLDLVQAVLDQINDYWPEIAAKEKRVKGIAPEKVEALPIHTRHGTYRGGYFPIAYDPTMSPAAGRLKAAEDAKLYQLGEASRATTKRGHTQARGEAGLGKPLRLSLNVADQHIAQVIHDLTHHEALLDANKLLNDDLLATTVQERLGPSALDQMRQHFKHIAMSDLADNAMDKRLRWWRNGMSVATIGFNFNTMAMQLTGAPQSIQIVGAGAFAKAVGRAFNDPSRTEPLMDWIYARSPMMQRRADGHTREMREVLASVRGGSWQQTIGRMAYYGVIKTQLAVDVPTWLAAYDNALAEGRAEADAAAMADQVVIDAQGGGAMKDLSGVQRSRATQLFTVFYSFFSQTLQRTTLAASQASQAGWTAEAMGRLMLDLLWLYAAPAALVMAVHVATGRKDDDEALVEMWGKEIGSLAFGNFIGLRDLSGPLFDGYGYRGPAGLAVFDAAAQLIQQGRQGELDEGLVKAAARLAGIATQLPTVQAVRTIEGIMYLAENPSADIRPLATGEPRE